MNIIPPSIGHAIIAHTAVGCGRPDAPEETPRPKPIRKAFQKGDDQQMAAMALVAVIVQEAETQPANP